MNIVNNVDTYGNTSKNKFYMRVIKMVKSDYIHKKTNNRNVGICSSLTYTSFIITRIRITMVIVQGLTKIFPRLNITTYRIYDLYLIIYVC